jgi:lipoate-protein ligase A
MLFLQSNSLDAAYHFAVEEWLAERPSEGKAFALWRTKPTVMLGANLVAEMEVDLDYAAQNGIEIVRRSSGGGAIYTDEGTIQYSIILPRAGGLDHKRIQADYLARPIIAALKTLGLGAEIKGRNDIVLGSKKITGMAQYIKGDFLCSHGSILVDANLDRLARALNVDNEKLSSKALKSVQSRVVNIKDYVAEDVTTEDFLAILKTEVKNFGHGQMEDCEITEEGERRISEICERKYCAREWTFGRSPLYTFRNSARFPAGKVELFIDVKGGKIKALKIYGDYLALRPSDEFADVFIGKGFNKEELREAIAGVDLPQYLGGVSSEEFLSVAGFEQVY